MPRTRRCSSPDNWRGDHIGAWGPGLFSDDLACDIRDEYRAALGITRFHVGVYKRSDPDYTGAGFTKVSSIRPRPGDPAITAGMYTQWSKFGSELDRWMNDKPL